MTLYAERRKKVLSLAKGSKAVAMTPANLFYLTDFWGGGVAIVEPEKTLVITSPLEAHRAGELAREADVVVVKRWADVVGEVLKRTGRGEVVVDDDGSLREHRRFKMRPSVFLEARRVKDEEEVKRITRASRGLDRIYEELPGVLKPGVTEWEAGAEVMKLATLNELTPCGGDAALSPTIIASGPNGALPHSELTGRKLRRGDFVVADIFFRYRGYNSDETRTFAVGTATARMKEDYAKVLEAQEEAMRLIKAGTVCEDVHLEAVRSLERNGVAKYLNHSIGHGVGIDIHELPNVSRGSKSKLVKNDVVTDEPGIYFPGKYGIRIEDTVRTDSSPVLLTRYTKDLVTTG